jgi:hypothetical protein
MVIDFLKYFRFDSPLVLEINSARFHVGCYIVYVADILGLYGYIFIKAPVPDFGC